MPFPNVLDTVHVSLAHGQHPSYRVRIADLDDTSFETEVPFDAGGHAVRWPVGTRVQVVFAHKESLYHFETTLLAFRPGNLLLYRWERPKEEEIQKIQRRAYYRVSVTLPADMLISGQRRSVQVINISAGGLAFQLPRRELLPGDVVLGTIDLPDVRGQANISFTAVVRRTEVTDDGWIIGVEFTGLRDADRTRIVRYCWQRQREIQAAAERVPGARR
ncbi:MAG: PilZ domain-containing protein [Thermoflavifilum sp.]|nr:PilZ domain-containing protein [Thermoflavifilum sp.]MCL6514240.1 flagellar brake protein [Alicyclobacillus sp.]